MKKTEIIIRNQSLLDRVIRVMTMLSLDEIWLVTIEKYSPKRSDSQNNFYWKWVDILGNHCGYNKEEMSTELKRLFLPATGRTVKIGLDGKARDFHTTTTLSKAEFAHYMDAIDRFAAEHGLVLPYPQDAQRRD